MATVRFSGPLFNAPKQAIDRATRRGMSRVGAQVEATVKLNAPSDTGELKRSIHSKLYRNGRGVRVSSNLADPRRTWSERGTRNGVKLTKAYYMFRKGKTKAKSLDFQTIVGNEIARELNG